MFSFLRRSTIAIALSFALLLSVSRQASSDDAKPQITRGPCVSFDKDGRATVELSVAEGLSDLSLALTWKAAAPSTEKVALAKADGGKLRATFPAGIEGSTVVDYEVLSGKTSLGKFKLKTLPGKDAKKVLLCALGDSGYPRRGRNVATEAQLGVAALLAKLEPDLVLHTGDVIYPTGQEAGLDALFFKPYGETLARVPFFCCLGNHDVKTRKGDPELASFPHPPNDHEGRWFSFDVANVHVTALDSNEPDDLDAPASFPDTPQGKWLKADLAAAHSTWKIVFFHHPLYSCYGTRVKERAQIRSALETLLQEGGVDLVLCGHDHFYHRSFRLKDGKKDDDGIVHIVTGGGGADLYPGKALEGITASYQERYHLTRLAVDGASLEIEALAPGERGEPESLDKTKLAARKLR